MFRKVRKTKLDLDALGNKRMRRKSELEGGARGNPAERQALRDSPRAGH